MPASAFVAPAGPRRPSQVLRLLALLGGLALVTLIRMALARVVNDSVPFAFYIPAIGLFTWYAGVRFGVLALLLSIPLAWVFFVPRGASVLTNIQLGLYFAGSLTMVWVVDTLHRSRDELVASREREHGLRRWYELMLDSIAEAVVALDANGNITFLNHAASALAGVSAESVQGRPFQQVFALRDASDEHVLGDLDALAQASTEITLVRTGQEPVPVALSLSPLRAQHAGETGTVLVLRLAFDERERARLAAEAEAARNDAEAANRMKDDFLRMVSHELRAPLNAILGWSDVLERKHDEATLLKACDTIRRSVRAQSSLIDSMLDVSAIASGKFHVAPQPIDAAAVAEEALRAIEPIAQAKHLHLVRDIDTRARTVQADPARLQQVFANLYANAIKFTPSGGTITTRLAYRDDDLIIAVTDTGQGITPEALGLLFERASASEPTLRRSKSGLGLGLAIARRVIELHGGRLEASSPGEHQGTTITVTLPLSGRPKPGSAEGNGVLSALHGTRLLVVDDDVQAALLLANVLESLGAQVQTADSAQRALELYRRAPPAGIVSDIGMPGQDGHWLMSEIRALDRQSGRTALAALAVTAYSRPEDRERSKTAGFDGHLAKPVTALAVAHALAEALMQRRGRPDNKA